MITLVGMEVYEYFSWPILITDSPSHISLGFSPSDLTTSLELFRKFMIVDLPTPVSPITMIASSHYSSLGMEETPILMSC